MGGKDTLIQWPNGDQQWCSTRDLDYTGSTITLIGGAEYSNNGQKENKGKDDRINMVQGKEKGIV